MARKFTESLEIAINLGIDPRQSDQAVCLWSAATRYGQERPRRCVCQRAKKADAAMAAGALMLLALMIWLKRSLVVFRLLIV